jgi:predicted protein tyrosine phosphatase
VSYDKVPAVTASPLVPYRITICGLKELCLHGSSGVSHVLTILDPEYPDPDDFAAYPPHRRHVWRFHDVINPGDGLIHPVDSHVRAILEFGEAVRAERVDHVLVHCHMGVSRSTATAAILLAQFNPGREDEAFAHIREIRPQSWPNSLMIALADTLLGRDGAFSKALDRHIYAVAHAYPEKARLLLGSERDHEVPRDIP